jgi:hypothetical protein
MKNMLLTGIILTITGSGLLLAGLLARRAHNRFQANASHALRLADIENRTLDAMRAEVEHDIELKQFRRLFN